MKQTTFSVFVTGGTIIIVPPSTPTNVAQNANTTAAIANGADAVVLPAAAGRQFAQIINPIGGSTNLFIAFGAAATVASVPFLPGAIYTIDPTTTTRAFLGDVHVFNNGVAPATVNILEFV